MLFLDLKREGFGPQITSILNLHQGKCATLSS